jgi:hypothetical protein
MHKIAHGPVFEPLIMRAVRAVAPDTNVSAWQLHGSAESKKVVLCSGDVRQAWTVAHLALHTTIELRLAFVNDTVVTGHVTFHTSVSLLFVIQSMESYFVLGFPPCSIDLLMTSLAGFGPYIR